MEDTNMITFVDTSAASASVPETETNSSAARDDDIYPEFKHAIVVMYVIVTCLALIGNGCVIYLVLSQRSMRNVTNYFIASLAASDALMALVCIPITFVSNVLTTSWPFAAWMCTFATYLQIVVVFQNAYTFMAISMERYIAIMYPFKRRLTVRQCTLVIALTWFMSFCTPLPTAIVSRLETAPNSTEAHCYEVWPGGDEQRFAYSMTIMVLQYFVPLAVLVYTYIRIVIVVWLKDTPPHGQIGGSYRMPLTQVSGAPASEVWNRAAAAHRESAVGFDARTGSYVDPRKRVSRRIWLVDSPSPLHNPFRLINRR